jgi:hypothetical protein
MCYQRVSGGVFFLAGLLIYASVSSGVRSLPRELPDEQLHVVMPGQIEVLLSLGDRYLAANIGMLRALMVSGRSADALTYQIQATIQRQVSIMNPQQEDNAYVAASVLSWENQVDSAQFILGRATSTRSGDYLAPFFQGFNEFYFNKAYQRAAQLMELSAARASGRNREAFKDVAAKWISMDDDTEAAIDMVSALRDASNDDGMRRRLQGRIDRLEGLQVLRSAAKEYRHSGSELTTLAALVNEGYLSQLPYDPFGYGYEVDDQGNVILSSRRKQ